MSLLLASKARSPLSTFEQRDGDHHVHRVIELIKETASISSRRDSHPDIDELGGKRSHSSIAIHNHVMSWLVMHGLLSLPNHGGLSFTRSNLFGSTCTPLRPPFGVMQYLWRRQSVGGQ